MHITISYPAFLKGRPARHRDLKQCLLALPLDVEIPEVSGEDAPMAIETTHNNLKVNFREYGGKLYRSLDIGAEKLGEQMNMRRIFDTKGWVMGSMARRALADYFRVAGRNQNVLPRNISLSGNQMVAYQAEAEQPFKMGKAFVVDEDDLDRARSYERQAVERMAGFIAVDGVMCYLSPEPVYSATPATDTGPGIVTIVTQGYAYDAADPHLVQRYAIWSQPEMAFFSALSGEDAARYAGIDPQELPSIRVADPTLVRSDFEALAIERLARNIVAAASSDFGSLSLQKVHETLALALDTSMPQGDWHDGLADLIAEAAAIARDDETDQVAKVLKGITPEVMDRVLDRWQNRLVEMSLGIHPSFP